MAVVTRGIAPVVGTIILVGITVGISAVISASSLGVTLPVIAGPVSFEVSAIADTNQIIITHTGGRAIDVSDIDLVLRIDDVALEHQPEVPFFSAKGFHSGPTGPFNLAGDSLWEVGEEAGFRVAATNNPSLRSGVRVSVEIYLEGSRIGSAATTSH